MKIICIGQNYLAHINELNSAIPDEPVFFLKPETALILNNKPFTLPDFSSDIHHEIEIVLKMNRDGKMILENNASDYYDELTVGIDFTARDIQKQLKAKGLPWEKAKAFDGAAPVGKFVSKKIIATPNAIDFHLNINEKKVQHGNTSDLIFSFDEIISYVSRFITLNVGDLIFTGTPVGVGCVNKGDHLDCFLENEKLLSFDVVI
ncbi:MAG: fumarylacetoacetate hydrolase family protein [Gammaproteobacteria bacterium]|nr:fumarylacetoacetate hydrolase family protein [Gammaproteobacteria bacterium]